MADRRGRATGRLGVKRGEHYALLPEELMASTAYCALPDWAKVVLFALASRFNGHNNGNLSLPWSEARHRGISAPWKLYAGLRVLEKTDLVHCTRRGRLERGMKIPSLYALTWRGIDNCERIAFDEGVARSPIPSNAWAKWIKPPDWEQVFKQINRTARGRKKSHTIADGSNHTTMDGAMTMKTTPPVMAKG